MSTPTDQAAEEFAPPADRETQGAVAGALMAQDLVAAQARIEELEGALRPYAEMSRFMWATWGPTQGEMERRARAALGLEER